MNLQILASFPGQRWLLVHITVPLWRKGKEWTAGIWHLALAFVWFILAVVVAPLVVAGGAAGAEVAGSGGTWFTLATIDDGNLIYWISMFLAAGCSPMRGIAYLLWIVSLILVLMAWPAAAWSKSAARIAHYSRR